MGVKMDGQKQNKNRNELKLLVTDSQSNPLVVRNSSLCDDSGPHLLASASSPSLLDGCGDTSTAVGSRIEQHCHAHHIHTGSCVTSPGVQQQPPVVTTVIPTTPSPLPSPAPLLNTPQSPDPSVFLTPAPPRRRNVHTERPSSAPPHHLERISGVLLRLVGDHYLCTTCGRQLRTIGDQLALETDIRRAFSSSHLYSSNENIS